MTFAIETFELTKRFPASEKRHKSGSKAENALNRVSLKINEGELFGLLGPNGAGKTTLIKILSTLIAPTSGQAVVNGCGLSDEHGVKRAIGLSSGDERGFFWRLTGRQNLNFFAALHRIPSGRRRVAVERVLTITGLNHRADTPVSTYSSGMKQRLCIARALINEPRILFLDEPTRGLDPTAARELRSFVREELTRRCGVTVLLTTHLLEEAEQLCDRIAVMENGVLKGCGTMADLKSRLGLTERCSLKLREVSPELREFLTARLPRARITGNGSNELDVDLEATDADDLSRLIDDVRGHDGKILGLNREQPSLWTIFDSLTRDDGGAESNQIPDIAIDEPGTASFTSNAAPPISKHLRGPFLARLRDALRVAGAFIKRDFLLETSYRMAFFLHVLGIFFSVAMFYFISRLLGPAAQPYLASYGSDYFSFVLIGIAFYTYSNVGLTAFSNNLREAQTTGTLEAILGTPTGILVTILSLSLWNFIFTTVDVLLYLAVGAGISDIGLNANYPAAVATLALTIIAMSSLGVMAGGFILIFKRGNPVLLIFSNLAGLLSGVYYPIDILPDWLQTIARFIPITPSLEAMRKALLKGASMSEVLPELSTLAVFIVIFLPLSLMLLRYAYQKARMDGSLTHY